MSLISCHMINNHLIILLWNYYSNILPIFPLVYLSFPYNILDLSLCGFATLKWEKKEIPVDIYPYNPRSWKHFLSERLASTLLRVSYTQEILSCLVVDMIFFSLERFGGVTITSSSFITIQVAYENGNDYLFTVASPLPCWMRGLITSPSKKGFLAGLQL